MDIGAAVAVLFWSLIVAAVAYDEARRECKPDNDEEARRAFDERHAREFAGRDA